MMANVVQCLFILTTSPALLGGGILFLFIYKIDFRENLSDKISSLETTNSLLHIITDSRKPFM